MQNLTFRQNPINPIMKGFIIVAFICLLNKTGTAQSLSPENVDQVCKAFVAMTDTALRQKQFERVAIYSNAFRLLKEQYPVGEKYMQYFKDVDLNNFKLIGDWVIGLNTNPKKPGGFVNIESLSSQQIKTLEQQIKQVKESRKIE